jgi:hypothetical protein
MMMADVHLWAMDAPPPANIIFISGSVDCCSVFQKLRERSYNVFLVCPSINQMPQDMLSAANDCLGWISFLRSLQDEDRQGCHLTFSLEQNKQKNPVSSPGGVNPNPTPKSKTNAETDPELKQKASAEEFREFIHKMLLAGEFSQGFELGRLRPKFEEQTGKILDVKHLGYTKLSELVASYSHLVSVDTAGTVFSLLFPKRPASSTEKKNPNRNPSPIVATGRKEKSGSLEKFKAWLGGVVNSKEYAENGYNISRVRMDFKEATGKTLDEMSMGFSKIIDLVEECKDVAVLKEVNQGYRMAFPIKPNKQKSPASSSSGVNPNPSPKIKPKSETNPKLKPIASVDDFRLFLNQMLLAGDFSKGFLMSRLPQKFEEQTGKFLEVQHLGYSKLSELVASYSHLVSVNNAGTTSSIFPKCPVSSTEKKTRNRNPSPSLTTGAKKKSGSLEKFKAWLGRVVNSKEYAENGYNISRIRMDFKEATGKTLDEMSLGFSKIIDLVEECKDVAVLKEVNQGCHVAFPVKRNKQKNPVSSFSGVNPNPSPKIIPKAKTDPVQKPIASADDFRQFLYQMLLAGEFSKSFLMSRLPQKFEEQTGKFLDVHHLGYGKLSELVASYSYLVSVNNAGTSISSIFPRCTASSTEKKNPNRNPFPSVTTGPKKSGSMKKFKAWLGRVVNSKEYTENGYNISRIRMDFKEATGKTLDETSLGFSKIIDLVEECKDVAVLKEVNQGCYMAFPVKPNKQKIPGASPGGSSPNLSKKLKSTYKPKSEIEPKLKEKASAEDFREFLYHMLLAGEFSQGFVMSRLRQRFEEHMRKFLDVEHLGYKKMSELVASFTNLVSVDYADPGLIRIFPSGYVNEAVPSNSISNTTSKVTSMSTDHDPTKMKAKVEADCLSSGVGGNELLQNRDLEENIYNKHFPYINSESERLSAMTNGSQTSVSSSPREANTRAFRECDIKSDSSSTLEVSQVSEWEGRSSTTISETTSFHGEGSSFINLILALQRDGNIPMGDLTIAKHLIAEAIESRRQRVENINFFGEPSSLVDTGLTDSFPQPSESPSLEPQADCNSPHPPLKSRAESSVVCAEDLRDGTILDCKQNEQNTKSAGEPQAGCSSPCAPLQSRAESSALCSEDLRDGIRLDCIKQNEKNMKSAGNEERSTSTSSAVSSAGSIIQLAERGIKSICELTTWRKN